MMFPQIPENLAALSASDLRALAAEIRVAAKTVLDAGDATAEQIHEALEFVAKRDEIIAIARAKDAAANAAANLSEDDEAEPEPAEAPATEAAEDDGDAEDDADTEDDGAEDDAAEDTDDEVEASVKPKVRTTMGVATVTEAAPAVAVTPDKLLARDGVSGKAAGSQFDSWGDLATALLDRAKSIRGNSAEKFEVAYIPGNFDEAHSLTEDFTKNLRLFEKASDPELMAEMCAPPIPQYDLACWNTDRRPVRNSMAAYKPDSRGAVSIYPSPTLSDITGQGRGAGIWTNDDDITVHPDWDGEGDPSEKTCAVIDCADPVVYRLYGVWRCLTVQNLLAMTFPELVEAYLNRLAAWHSRIGEVQLLEAMATESIAVDAQALGYGSTTSITTSLLTLLTLHQEQERWDLGETDVWMPRWILNGIKTDLMRRRNSSGNPQAVPSDAQVAGLFRSVGAEPHFFIDTPSWATPVPAVHSANTLNLLPNQVEMIVAPRGKFAVMDRGELSIGVTGNNIYRDNASNSKNQFTMFFENFEGLVNTNSCPAYLLTVEGLCHNGVQIDDAVIDCVGVGEGS